MDGGHGQTRRPGSMFRGYQPAMLRSWVRGSNEQPHGLLEEYAAGESQYRYTKQDRQFTYILALWYFRVMFITPRLF